jgi:hypothetical protein
MGGVTFRSLLTVFGSNRAFQTVDRPDIAPPCVRLRCANGTYQSSSRRTRWASPNSAQPTNRTDQSFAFNHETNTKVQAVCRAAGRGERRRCAVRMTAKGSVTPWMACGSRPVKRIPERGAFPTVGIHQRPGVKGAGPFAPLPPPPTAGWQIAIADQGGTGSSQSQIQIPKFRSAISQPPLVGPRGNAAVAMAERLAGASDGRHDPLRVIKKQNRLPREPV